MVVGGTKAEEIIAEDIAGLFDPPRIEASYETSFPGDTVPLATSSRADLLEFLLQKSEHFLDTSECYLSMHCKILNQSPASKFQAAPVHAFFYALFDRVEIELNGTPLTSTFRDVPYKAFFTILFKYPKCVKDTSLGPMLWIEDEWKYITERKLPPENNEGLEARYNIAYDVATNLPREFQVIGRLMHEFFFLEEYIIPGVQVRMRLFRKPDSFCLLTNADDNTQFEIQLTEIKLHYRYVKPFPKYVNAIEKKLSSTAATYAIYDAFDIRARQLQAGMKSFALDNFFDSQVLPNRVIFALVTDENYLGSLKHNPFHFQSFGLEQISVIIENQTLSYKVDFEHGFYGELFMSLSSQMGMKQFDCSPNIKYADMANGLAFFPFDLTASRDTHNAHISTTKNVRVELNFKNFLTQHLQLLILTESPFMFQLDKQRNLINNVKLLL
jgi:hypothetical protein